MLVFFTGRTPSVNVSEYFSSNPWSVPLPSRLMRFVTVRSPSVTGYRPHHTGIALFEEESGQISVVSPEMFD